MVYNIARYDGAPLASVQDSTIDTTSTSISLIGKNAVNFGLPLNENFIALMQNFAGTNPPPKPVTGQIWFDTVSTSLKVWDGFRWIVVTPPFDGNAGTASISITPTVGVVAMLSAGQIVSIASHTEIQPSELPDTVSIADKSYDFKVKFPNGLMPGITLAVDSNRYRFFGTATTANALATSRNISLTGSTVGTLSFDGSNDVVMTTSLINVLNSNLNTSSYWTKVLVNSNGLVTDANVIVNNDIWTALGYTPPSDVVITGDARGNAVANGTVFTVNVTLSNTAVAPGSYNNVTVDSAGRVVAASNDYPIPVRGIIIWNDPLIPNGWALCNGQTVTTDAGIIYTPDLTADQIGSTRFIMRVS